MDKTRLVFDHLSANFYLSALSRRARQMPLLTSYVPALTHRSKSVPPRPRSLFPSTSARLRSSDETATDHAKRPSIKEPKPRAVIPSFLHNLHGANLTGIGRPTFCTRSTDGHNGAYRRGLRLPPPRPTGRSALDERKRRTRTTQLSDVFRREVDVVQPYRVKSLNPALAVGRWK